MITQGRIFSTVLVALLANVPKSLRALVITLNQEKKETHWIAYYDSEAEEEDFEAIRVANTNFISDFNSEEIKNSSIKDIILPYPEPITKKILSPPDGYLVFLRYEKT